MWRSVANHARSFVRPTLGLCGLTRLRITMTCNSRNLDSCHMDSSEFVFTAPCCFSSFPHSLDSIAAFTCSVGDMRPSHHMARATIAQHNVTVGRRVVPPVHPCPLLSSAQGQDSPRGSDATSKRHRNIGATFPTISFR